MEIDFNNARKSTGLQFNKVAKLLKSVTLPSEIIEEYNRLGSYIGTILATYDDNNEYFKDLSEEVTLTFIEEE